MAAAVKSVTATDKWTVVYKLTGPIVGAEKDIFDDNNGWIYPPEVLKKQDVDAKPPGFGMPGIEDVTDLVGTGPFMLTEFVEGSSLTFVKNPDYWSDDEKYPGNRLPYIDELRAVIICQKWQQGWRHYARERLISWVAMARLKYGLST